MATLLTQRPKITQVDWKPPALAPFCRWQLHLSLTYSFKTISTLMFPLRVLQYKVKADNSQFSAVSNRTDFPVLCKRCLAAHRIIIHDFSFFESQILVEPSSFFTWNPSFDKWVSQLRSNIKLPDTHFLGVSALPELPGQLFALIHAWAVGGSLWWFKSSLLFWWISSNPK